MPKKEAAADEPVNARRLQPIYEALDARNYKQAIKLLTAAMEKHGQAHILLALLAVTYERTGRRDDALSTCAKVAAQRPSDEAVLSTLAHVYRAVDAPHAIVSLYEVASNSPAAQSSEDFLASMFVAYTRVGAHVKMQQTAMRLAKITKTDRYLAWAALNMAFQVPKSGPHSTLALAEMMLLKSMPPPPTEQSPALSSGSLESVFLLLRLQLQQHKCSAAFHTADTWLRRELSSRDPALFLRALLITRAHCLADISGVRVTDGKAPLVSAMNVRMKSDEQELIVRAMRDIAVELIQINSDDWSALCFYLDMQFLLAFHSQTSAPTFVTMSTDHELRIVEETRKFLSDVAAKESTAGNSVKRGPFLAQLELEYRLLIRSVTAKTPTVWTSEVFTTPDPSNLAATAFHASGVNPFALLPLPQRLKTNDDTNDASTQSHDEVFDVDFSIVPRLALFSVFAPSNTGINLRAHFQTSVSRNPLAALELTIESKCVDFLRLRAVRLETLHSVAAAKAAAAALLSSTPVPSSSPAIFETVNTDIDTDLKSGLFAGSAAESFAIPLLCTRLAARFVAYVSRFVDRPCCVDDCARYIHCLPVRACASVLYRATLEAQQQLPSVDSTTALTRDVHEKRTRCGVHLTRLAYLAGALDTINEQAVPSLTLSTSLPFILSGVASDHTVPGNLLTKRRAVLERLVAHCVNDFVAFYQSMQAYHRTPLDVDQSKEICAGDQYMQLAVHALLHLHEEALDNEEKTDPFSNNASERPRWLGYLCTAIVLLEFALTKSKFNHHFRLLLLRLYQHPAIGAAVPAQTAFRALDLKTVQHESMSYLCLPDAQRFGAVDELRKMTDGLIRFHHDHARESPESVGLAYRHGSFDSLIDFERFRVRLQQSAALAQTALARAHLHVIDAFAVCASDPVRRLVQATAGSNTDPGMELGVLPGDAEWDSNAGVVVDKNDKTKVLFVPPVGLHQLPLSVQLTLWLKAHAPVDSHLWPVSKVQQAMQIAFSDEHLASATAVLDLAPTTAATPAPAPGPMSQAAAQRKNKLNALDERVRALRLSGGHPGASWLTAHALDAHCWNQDFTLFASFVPPVLPKLPSAFGNTDLQSAQSELNMFAAATDPRQNSNFPLRFGFLSFPLPPNLISYPYSITQNGEIMDVYQGGLSAYRSSWQHHSLLTITWPACVRAALIGDSNLLRSLLRTLASTLTSLGLLDVSAAAECTVSSAIDQLVWAEHDLTATRTSMFEKAHWRLMFLVLEHCACALESAKADEEFFAALDVYEFDLTYRPTLISTARTTVVNDSKSAHSHRCHTLVTQQRTIALAFKQLNDYLSTRLTGRAPDVGSEDVVRASMFVRSGTQTPFSTTGVHALPIAEFSLYFQHVLPVWVAVAPLLAVWSVGVRQLLKQRRQRIVQLVAELTVADATAGAAAAAATAQPKPKKAPKKALTGSATVPQTFSAYANDMVASMHLSPDEEKHEHERERAEMESLGILSAAAFDALQESRVSLRSLLTASATQLRELVTLLRRFGDGAVTDLFSALYDTKTSMEGLMSAMPAETSSVLSTYRFDVASNVFRSHAACARSLATMAEKCVTAIRSGLKL